MADVKITSLPAAGTLTGNEQFELVQGGASKRGALENREAMLKIIHDAPPMILVRAGRGYKLVHREAGEKVRDHLGL